MSCTWVSKRLISSAERSSFNLDISSIPNLLWVLIDTFASSEAFDATLPNSFLLSSERAGIGIRTTSPSLVGLRPISAFNIDFSISSNEFLSKGWITRSFGSGTDLVASCWRGVFVP